MSAIRVLSTARVHAALQFLFESSNVYSLGGMSLNPKH
jgi:hypothetical protein